MSEASKPEFEIEKLRREHDLSQFDCSNATLNAWLQKYAWTNQQADSAKTYVALASHLGMGMVWSKQHVHQNEHDCR